MRLIGLDYGAARIGVALGDTVTRVASPWNTIHHETMEDTIQRLRDLMKREQAEALIVGIPRPLSDQSRETAQALEVKQFIAELQAAGFVVHEQNETLSSKVAAVQVKEMGGKGKRDDLAAAAILQDYLDKQP